MQYQTYYLVELTKPTLDRAAAVLPLMTMNAMQDVGSKLPSTVEGVPIPMDKSKNFFTNSKP